MPCIEKDDQAIATSIDANEEQSDSENTRTYGKIKRELMDHIAEKKYVGSFHTDLVHKSTSIQEMIPKRRG